MQLEQAEVSSPKYFPSSESLSQARKFLHIGPSEADTRGVFTLTVTLSKIPTPYLKNPQQARGLYFRALQH